MAGGTSQKIVTGVEYVQQITALESDRRARAAFLDLALKVAPPGAALFDFGAGPGIDARFYAEQGRGVAAYDVDAKMCEFFAEHCRDLITAGSVRLETGTYPQFLARHRATAGSAIDLVTANFAPLNLIGDLNELFATFHALTGPSGKVLASVLNPYFIGDLRYSWWWRNAPRLWWSGHFSVPGAQAPIIRRRLADFAGQGAPYFKLERVFRGLPSKQTPQVNGVAGRPRHRPSWMPMTTSRFLFLLFQKCGLRNQARPH
jgi:SAM-dependent methyltransferase